MLQSKSQFKLKDASCQTAFTPGQRNYSSDLTSCIYQYPLTPPVNRFHQQRFLVIGSDRTLLKIAEIINQTYPQAEVITARNYTTALKLIEQIQPQCAIADLEFLELIPGSPRIDAGLKLVKRLLTSHWHPNILVFSDSLSYLNYLQPAIKNYQGGFAAIDKPLSNSDLACYIDLIQWGIVHPPEILKPYPEFQARWLKLLYLRYQEGFNDRAIASKLQVSDRTIRNYWTQIQQTFDIKDDPEKDAKVLIGIAARRIGLID